MVPDAIFVLTAATLFAKNLYRPIFAPAMTDDHVAKLARVMVVVLALISLYLSIHSSTTLVSLLLLGYAGVAQSSRVASGLLRVHAIAITPAGSMKLVRSSISIDCGLPCVTVRSAPAIVFSGPAQRSLMLWPARSPSRLATLYIESSDSFVASAAASIATGWSKPVPGRELHPLKSSAFHGALLQQLSPARAGPTPCADNLRASDPSVQYGGGRPPLQKKRKDAPLCLGSGIVRTK